MSEVLRYILESNKRYASEFDSKADLPALPARRVALLTCMDARLDPLRFAGLTEGDAHIVRNAGGRATDDAIRSLVISHKLLGTRDWLVVHHTHCGMQSFTDDVMARLLETSLETAELTPKGWRNSKEEFGSSEGRFIRWFTISDPEETLVTDVRRIREHPLVSPTVSIHGFLFDVKTGRLMEVPEARRIGQATRECRGT
jgi:carbonic anhydrase